VFFTQAPKATLTASALITFRNQCFQSCAANSACIALYVNMTTNGVACRGLNRLRGIVNTAITLNSESWIMGAKCDAAPTTPVAGSYDCVNNYNPLTGIYCSCGQGCASCTIVNSKPTTCLACQNNYYLFNGTCGAFCPIGFAGQPSSASATDMVCQPGPLALKDEVAESPAVVDASSSTGYVILAVVLVGVALVAIMVVVKRVRQQRRTAYRMPKNKVSPEEDLDAEPEITIVTQYLAHTDYPQETEMDA